MKLADIKRKKQLYENLFIVSGVVTGLSFILFMVYPFLLIGFLFGGIGMIYTSTSVKKLSIYFKTNFVKDVVHEEYPHLAFDPYRGFPKETVYDSKVLRKEDRYSSEDYLAGEIQGYFFESADVHLQDVRSTGKTTTVVTVFQGRFFIFDAKKFFSKEIYVFPRQFLSRWLPHLEKVELESIEFNQTYNVYTEDKHSAYLLLKPVFLEKLIEFRNIAHRVMFGFKKDKIYIAVDTRKDTFDLKMFKPIDEAFFTEIQKEMLLIYEMIQLID